MKKKEFQTQKIKRRICTQKGQVHWVMGLFMVLTMSVLLLSVLQIFGYRITACYMEDALAASNLASALVDLPEYGSSHKIRIVNPLQAYERYCEALKGNLNLDEAFQCPNQKVVSGPVRIVSYIIYNVWEDMVQICFVTDGRVQESYGVLGTVMAPNGLMVESTSIYSEICFPVRGIWNIEVTAKKGKLVDIVAEGKEL